MRSLATILVWAAVSAFPMPVFAQQDLSEVAGKIKLKGSEGETVVIDGKTVGSTRKTFQSREPGEVLYAATHACYDPAKTLLNLVGEIGSVGRFFEAEWRSRVSSVGAQFDDANRVFVTAYVPERFSTAHQKAESGVGNVESGLALLRTSIADERPRVTEIAAQVSSGVQLLDEAIAGMGSLVRTVEAEQPSRGIDPYAAIRAMEALCSSRFGSDSTEGYQGCMDQQEAARHAIENRFFFTVGVGEPEFNSIRNNCAYEWPKDFVQRDTCETRRMAAASQR